METNPTGSCVSQSLENDSNAMHRYISGCSKFRVGSDYTHGNENI